MKFGDFRRNFGQIVGTHRSRERIPTLEEEPLWMRMATTAPAPAGCAMFRDIRAWHVRGCNTFFLLDLGLSLLCLLLCLL